jgi:hypothetical protein
MKCLVFSRSAICDLEFQGHDYDGHFIKRIQREGISTQPSALKEQFKTSLYIWRIGSVDSYLQPIHEDRLLLEFGENRLIFDALFQADGVTSLELLNANVPRGLYAEKDKLIIPNSPYYMSEISRSIPSLYPFFDRDGTIKVIPPRKRIKIAQAVYAGFNSNYYHFTWEVAPRLLSFYDDIRFKGVPVVLNKQIPPSLLEFVTEISGVNPILLGDDQQAIVEKLFVVFDGRYTGQVDFKDKSNGNIFAPRLQDLVRLREFTPKMKDNSSIDTFKKIFVGRPDFDARVPSNLLEVKEFFSTNDFHQVPVDSISLREQISIFREAEVICIITGAAVTNLVYCQNLRKLIILVVDQSETFMTFWNEYCDFLGLEATFLYTENSKKRFGPLSISSLSQALN